MTKFTKTFTALAIAFAATSASAGTIALPSGLSLDPKTSTDPTQGEGNFDHGFNFVQWWENAGTPASLSSLNPTNLNNFKLNGYGELEIANDIGKLECSGCEISFNFSDIGLELVSLDEEGLKDVIDRNRSAFANANTFNANDPSTYPTDENILAYAASEGKIFPDGNGGFLGAELDIDTAALSIFVDYTPDLSVNSTPDSAWVSQATDGIDWLVLDFQEVNFTSKAPDDGVFGLSSADTTFGFLAAGGEAFDNFNDAQGISWASQGISLLSDVIGFGLSASFNENSSGDLEIYSSVGTGNVRGNVVSAPATLGFLGLSVIGTVLLARRRKASVK